VPGPLRETLRDVELRQKPVPPKLHVKVQSGPLKIAILRQKLKKKADPQGVRLFYQHCRSRTSALVVETWHQADEFPGTP
jgi:hypothetical protein